MSVVGIRDVGVTVPRRFMPMRVAVRSVGHGVVSVVVVAVVVPVGVLVLLRVVLMLMLVGFGKVQGNAQQHQKPAHTDAPGDRLIAQGESQSSADEGRKRENGTGPGGAELPLSKKVEAQAQAVAGRPDSQQPSCRAGAR